MLPPLTMSGWLRYDLVARALSGLDGVHTILEIGAGMGALGTRLARDYEYVGVEPDSRSFSVAQQRVGKARAATVLNGDVSALPPGFRTDLVCAFEVLEHIEDDEGALREWRELLQPGGTLMISVPAWRRRFGASDAKVGHYRRYDRSDVLGLLERTGFVDVRVLIYGFPVGYALQPIWNALAKRSEASASVAERTSASGRWIQPPLWLGWAPQLLSLPFRGIQRPLVNTNLGTGFLAIARRPDGDTSASRIASRPSNGVAPS